MSDDHQNAKTSLRATDIIKGTSGNDTLTTHAAGVKRVYGYQGDDVLDLSIRGGGAWGGQGNDTFYGGGAGTKESHMYGGPGRDVFYFGTTNRDSPFGDHVWGGEGSDQFHFTTQPNDTAKVTGRIDDFDPSRDSIWLNGTKLDLQNLPSNVHIVQHLSQPWILIDGRILYALEGARQFDGAINAHEGNSPESIEMGNAASEETHFIKWPESWANGIPKSAYVNYIDQYQYFPQFNYHGAVNEWELPTNKYTDGPDLVQGKDIDERLIGGDGADTIYGRGGNDLIHAGEYDDVVYGGAGNDSISGGLDNDLIRGDGGNDWIYGGSGQDTVYGGMGNDIIYGGNGLDTLYGDDGHDTISGSGGSDVIYGGKGNDVLYASLPRDEGQTYYPYNSMLYGGDGDDTMHVEEWGQTTMTGGAGADVMVLRSGGDVTFTDFETGIDYLDWNGVSPGHDIISKNMTEIKRADGGTDMFFSLDGLGTLLFQGFSEADRAALLASMGQEGPIKPPPEGGGDDDDDDKDPPPDEAEDDGGGGCFVATACFGREAHPDVAWLRQFRSKILRKSMPGRAFIQFYWLVGPHLAKLVDHNGKSGAILRKFLGALVTKGRKTWPDL